MLSAAAFALAGASTHADDIATWVDADGITHFEDVRLAPHSAGTVEVGPANGMAIPKITSAPSRSGGPGVVVLEKKLNRQPIGWRGYEWNKQRNRGHRGHR